MLEESNFETIPQNGGESDKLTLKFDQIEEALKGGRLDSSAVLRQLDQILSKQKFLTIATDPVALPSVTIGSGLKTLQQWRPALHDAGIALDTFGHWQVNYRQQYGGGHAILTVPPNLNEVMISGSEATVTEIALVAYPTNYFLPAGAKRRRLHWAVRNLAIHDKIVSTCAGEVGMQLAMMCNPRVGQVFRVINGSKSDYDQMQRRVVSGEGIWHWDERPGHGYSCYDLEIGRNDDGKYVAVVPSWDSHYSWYCKPGDTWLVFATPPA